MVEFAGALCSLAFQRQQPGCVRATSRSQQFRCTYPSGRFQAYEMNVNLDRTEYRKQLIETAKQLSDRECQIRLWFSQAGEKQREISTPTEIIAAFFHDSHASAYGHEFGDQLSFMEVSTLNELLSSIDALPGSLFHVSPEKVMDDLDWSNVRQRAATFVSIWEREGGI